MKRKINVERAFSKRGRERDGELEAGRETESWIEGEKEGRVNETKRIIVIIMV